MNGLDQQTAGTRYAQLGAQIEDLALVLEAVNQAGLSNVATALRKAENFTLERVDKLRKEFVQRCFAVEQADRELREQYASVYVALPRRNTLWGRLRWLVTGA